MLEEHGQLYEEVVETTKNPGCLGRFILAGGLVLVLWAICLSAAFMLPG